MSEQSGTAASAQDAGTAAAGQGRDAASGALGEWLGELNAAVGPKHVLVEPAAQQRFLRDFSWYSPVLSEAFTGTRIDAVVQPGTLDELEQVVAIGVRHRVPMTVRGAGTGNYGQSVPLFGGILIDMRRLNRIESLEDDAIEVEAGAVWEDVEAAARQCGRELRILPTTHHIATVGGFLAGGSSGLGAVTYGRTWDGNFTSVEVLTADDPPVYAYYYEANRPLPADAKPGQGIHHPNFGVHLKEAMDKLRIRCVVRHKDEGADGDREMAEFFRECFVKN